jgi:hypothetical protein
MRQWGLALVAYSNDYNGQFVPAFVETPTYSTWDELLEPAYIPANSESILGCPAAPYYENPAYASFGTHMFGFGYNEAIAPLNYSNVSTQNYCSLRITDAPPVENFVVIADTELDPGGGIYSLLYPRHTWNPSDKGTEESVSWMGSPHGAHSQLTNVLYGDMHVESVQYNEPWTKFYLRWMEPYSDYSATDLGE